MENHPTSDKHDADDEHIVDAESVLAEGRRVADEVASETELRGKTQLHDVEELRADRLDAIARARARLEILEAGSPEYASTERLLQALETALTEYEGQMGAPEGENTPGQEPRP